MAKVDLRCGSNLLRSMARVATYTSGLQLLISASGCRALAVSDTVATWTKGISVFEHQALLPKVVSASRAGPADSLGRRG